MLDGQSVSGLIVTVRLTKDERDWLVTVTRAAADDRISRDSPARSHILALADKLACAEAIRLWTHEGEAVDPL
jgi:hypothetical protein